MKRWVFAICFLAAVWVTGSAPAQGDGTFRFPTSIPIPHPAVGITSGDFDALVQDLVGALDKFKVGEKEKGELLGALGPMKADIVTK